MTLGRPQDPASGRRGVCLIGAFPPPVHGASLVNARIREELERRGVMVRVIDVSPRSLTRSLGYMAHRVGRIIRGFSLLLRQGFRPEVSAVYFGLSGGYGQVYELAFILLARVQRLRIFLHHHSYAYLRDRRLVAWMLVTVAGSAASHIALCEDMAQRLRALYPGVRSVFLLSNAAMLGPGAHRRVRASVRTIAFFSNVSYDKGIREFLHLVKRIRASHPEVTGVIGGPFVNSEVETLVLDAVRREVGISYVGPRYGESREEFFDQADVLIFPSSYEHEADPLTVHEAMSQGLPVICWNRGCLAGVVPPECGLVVDGQSSFVEAAAHRLRDWCEHPGAFAQASRSSLARAASVEAQVAVARESLLVMLAGATV